jgi:SAM-dependent methyltransferase
MIRGCPLCRSGDSTLWAVLSARDLEYIYRRAFGIRIETLTQGTKEISLLRCAGCDLGFFVPAIAGDVRFYEQLESFDWYYTVAKSEFDFAARRVAASDAVLEIGCGAGHFAQKISARAYVGLELTPLAARRARSSGLDVREETIEQHAVGNKSRYDVVCAFQVLEHIADTRSFLRSALESLRPGGQLILSVPSADGYVGRAQNNCLNLPPHHVTWWTDKALAGLARVLNLELIELEHEPLAEEHADAYVHTMISRGIYQPSADRSLVDLSLRGRVVFRLASYTLPLVRRRVLGSVAPLRGHSATAVYRRLAG